MKSKRIKSKETDTNIANRKTAVDDVDPSQFTVHGSRFTFFTDSRFHIACLVLLIVVIYANTLNAPFQWDEDSFLVNNPIIKDLHYFTNPSAAKGLELYSGLINRYIGYLTFALNYKIHGFSVTGYHIVNIAIHIANSILVYFLVLLTFRGSGTWDQGPETRSPVPGSQSPVPGPWSLSPKLVAFFSAAIFAVHPLQTEAVTYVFQRFASLAAMFYLLSIVMYIKARIGNGLNSKNVIPYSRITFLLISLVSAVLAMKTKENAFTLPLVIVLYEFCFFSDSPSPVAPRRSSLVSRFLYLVPILLTLLIVPLTLMSQSGTHQLDPGAYGAKVFSRNEYLFTQFRVIVTYLRLLFFPVNQNAAYYYPVFKSFFDPQVLLSFLFLSALFGFGLWLILAKNRRPSPIAHSPLPAASRPLRLIGFGILWFFITLSVESSIIPLPMLLDEYRMYLPSVGLIISIVTGVFWVFSRFTVHVSRPLASRFTAVLLVLAIGVLSVATHLRNEVWGDGIRLWEDIVKKSPGNVRAHDKLGLLYMQKKLYDKAINEINIVIGMSPYYADAHHNLGVIYQGRNMFDKAIEEYLIAISLNPALAEAHNNLGVCYKALNMFDKAIEQYMIAIKLKPDYADAHNNLGVIYLTLNMPDKAMNELQIGVNLMPTDAKAHFYLGDAYLSLNMPDKAMEQYLMTVKLRPDYVEAHNNLGGIYQAFNMLDKAVDELQIVIKLKPDYAEAYFNLGSLYYRMGQMENARAELMAGLKIKPEDQQAQQLLNQAIGNRQ